MLILFLSNVDDVLDDGDKVRAEKEKNEEKQTKSEERQKNHLHNVGVCQMLLIALLFGVFSYK